MSITMTHSNRFDNAFEVEVQRDDALRPPKGGAPSHVGTQVAMSAMIMTSMRAFRAQSSSMIEDARRVVHRDREPAMRRLRSSVAMLDNR